MNQTRSQGGRGPAHAAAINRLDVPTRQRGETSVPDRAIDVFTLHRLGMPDDLAQLDALLQTDHLDELDDANPFPL